MDEVVAGGGVVVVLGSVGVPHSTVQPVVAGLQSRAIFLCENAMYPMTPPVGM